MGNRSSRRRVGKRFGGAGSAGIEVYGLGIKVPDIEALFPVSRSIDEVADLAGAMFGMLQEALSGRAPS